MKIQLQDHSQVDIMLYDNAVSDIIQRIFKHLQHVPIPFRKWDNPFYFDSIDYDTMVSNLIEYGRRVQVEVDKESCINRDQNYFNFLHRIYENSYNGEPRWLDYHEHIHACELFGKPRRILHLDYRETAGMLEKPFDVAWLKNSKTSVDVGEVFISWAELGKTPYQYWLDNEPNNISRICALVKPWALLRPKLCVALAPLDFLHGKKIVEFNQWWTQYHDDWCQHWHINQWTIDDMFSIMPIGKVREIDTLAIKLKNQINPLKVSL